MSLIKCPKCGEMFSDSYKSCPFCAEDDAYFDGGVKPKPRKKGAGRRVEGHDRGPNILGPALIVVVVLLAAVLIYSFFGDKISQWLHRNDPTPVEITLTVEPAAADLSVGEIRALNANGVEKVLWFSSDEAVATVDEQGNVTAVSPGEVTITASDEEGKLSAQCAVKVTEADPNQGTDPNQGGNTTPDPNPNQGGNTTPDPDPNQGGNTTPDPTPAKKDLAIGAAWSGQALPMLGNQYDVTVDSEAVALIIIDTGNKNQVIDAKEITWKSEDTSKVTVDADGVVTRKAGGQVTITATVDGQTLECIVR